MKNLTIIKEIMVIFFEMLQFLPVNFLLVKKTTNISIFAQLLIVLLKYAFL